MGIWSSLFGKKDPPVPPGKVWVMGTAPWGGVLLECGSMEMVLVLLPITDASLYRQLPQFPPGTIKAMLVCNDETHGVLAARRVAAQVGVTKIYATDSDKPIDRPAADAGAPGRVEVIQLRTLTVGPLEVAVYAGSVWAAWSNGTTALIGDAISVDAIADEPPMNVLGRITATRAPDATRPLAEVARAAAAAIKSYVAMPTVPARAEDLAIARAFTDAPAVVPPLPALELVMTAIIKGELDRADTLAETAIARGETVAELRFQRALIAMMRDDDAAAIRELEQSADGDPKAASSLCQLYARKHDPRARALAGRALEQLPADPIVIRGAILAHALTGDPAGARAILAAHGAHLPAGHREAYEASIDDPPAPRKHRFPEHAGLAAEAAKPLVDAKQFAKAEPLLRRAVALDDSVEEHVVELGFVLAQLDRNADAVAVYDAAIANGGSPLLRFNRGNCLLRLERFAAAVDEYRQCIAALPSQPDLRVNLISALFANGERDAAAAELVILRASGGANAQTVRSLERMLAGTL